MNVDDEDIGTMLRARGNRTGWIDADQMVADALGSPRPTAMTSVRSTLRSTLGVLREVSGQILLVAAVAAIGIAAVLQGGAPSPPTGRLQSVAPVGTGILGSMTCVSLDLTRDAYEAGQVRLWWWAPAEGESDCRTSSSGPMEAGASLERVGLVDDALGSLRSVYRVSLDLELIGGGMDRVEFILDPFGQRPTPTSIGGFAGRDLHGRALEFRQIPGLDVTPPGGVPAPTPDVAPPN